jgi:hypothetical protein
MNFATGIILGGPMQHLYGMIRSLQLLVFPSLMNIIYPSHTSIFFSGIIVFAAMDVLSGETLYEMVFNFRETPPLTPKFELFKMSDKNFYMNSGSYLIM